MKYPTFHSGFVICGALGAFLAGACLIHAAEPQPGAPAKRPVAPPPVYTAPTFAGAKFPAPILDDVFKADPISLETKGKSPREAFDVLGKAVGVRFKAGRDHAPPAGVRRTIWEMKTYEPLDFDIKDANFWQAATRIGDAAGLFPLGGHREMSLEALPPSWVFTTSYAKQIMDMRTLRATLSTTMTSGPRGGISFDINLQVDPRVKLLAVGKVVWQGTGNGEGMPEEMDVRDQKYPSSDTLRRSYTGIQSISQSLLLRNLKDMNADVTFEWLHGYVPVTAAVGTKPLEIVLEGDEVKDLEPHVVGDWKITASKVQASPRPAALNRGGGGGGGGALPDHAFSVTVERLKDTAPPFPQNVQAICTSEGNMGNVGVSLKEEKKQEWTFSFYSSVNTDREPLKKIILDVPIEAKEAVLPFEFKHVVFSALP